jgi:hypothetical protein
MTAAAAASGLILDNHRDLPCVVQRQRASSLPCTVVTPKVTYLQEVPVSSVSHGFISEMSAASYFQAVHNVALKERRFLHETVSEI